MPMPEVAFPCGSASTRRTRCPQEAITAARLTAVVVFPTPPFWLATAMDLAIIQRFHLVGTGWPPKPNTHRADRQMFHVKHERMDGAPTTLFELINMQGALRE